MMCPTSFWSMEVSIHPCEKVGIKADTHEGFCSRSILQAHFARVSTHEGAFSSSLNLPRERAPKYLTCWISWSILRGGNSAPEDEVHPWNRWYTRRSFAPGACPWSRLREQNPSCVSAFILYWRVHFLPPMVLAYKRLNSDLLLQCNLTIHTCGSSVIVLLFITDTYTEFLFY